MPQQVQLKYTPIGGTLTTKTLNVNSVRGSSDPDDFDIFPGIQHAYLSGALEEQIKGFRRNIEIDFGVILDFENRLAVLNFLLDSSRQLVCLSAAPANLVSALQSGGTLTASTAFYYKVTAVDNIGESAASVETTKTTDVTNKTIKLDWDKVSNAVIYKIYRKETVGGAYKFVTYTTANTYTDTGSIAGVTGTPPSAAATINVALAEPGGFANEWLDGGMLSRRFVLRLKDNALKTAFPI